MEWTREKKTVELFIEWLRTKGYVNIRKSKRNEQYDIYAEKRNSKWWFEVKGCPISRRTKHQQMVHYFQGGIGKIISIMQVSRYKKYGIVFPNIDIYERKILRLNKMTRRKLGIYFYMIDKNANVEILRLNNNKFSKY